MPRPEEDFINRWAQRLWDVCRTEEYYEELRCMVNETLQMGRHGVYGFVKRGEVESGEREEAPTPVEGRDEESPVANIVEAFEDLLEGLRG
jgi:hypothetical protein